jgi:gamma-glutamyltranspeptidase/glutathione hydrolase
VDVPGAVRGWDELSRRFGRLGLEGCLRTAIAMAREGVPAAFNCARAWETCRHAPSALGAPPAFGQRFTIPGLADVLEGIAAHGPEFFYTGPPARAIVEATWLEHADLAEYRPRWVQPLTHTYRGIDVSELPPPTQGVAALEALAILGDEAPKLEDEVLAVSLALEDALAHVRDGADVAHLLSPEHITHRRRRMPARVGEPAGGTVYLCAVDGDGLAVSITQSLYEAFGSGVMAGGVILNNRAAGFAVEGTVVPGRRPYHTLIPGMLTRGGELVGPFGVMGGFIQAQAHVQFVCELVRGDLDPQAALDRGRFRLEGATLALEEPLWEHAESVEGLGFRIERRDERQTFGGGQAIIRRDGALFGGSDARKDGCALGI